MSEPFDLAPLLDGIRPGQRIYVQGGAGEPLALRSLLKAQPEALAGVEIVSCLLPGMNEFDYAALHPDVRVTVFMLPAGARASFEAGRTRVRPLAYSQIAAVMQREPPFDLAVLQVAPADARGMCSLGPCGDFGPLVWPAARRRVAIVNPSWPACVRGPAIPYDALDLAIEQDGPFICGEDVGSSPALEAIAEIVAAHVPDGAAIQTGIGGAPAAAVGRLTGRRGLRVRSGMVTEGYRSLHEAGAIDPDFDHRTGLALGTPQFMAWAARTFHFVDASQTHGAAALADTQGLYAINSALEVDLFGQVNLEWRDGRLSSGLGGAPDFARAAHRGGGRAMLAFPATGRGGVSRIRPRLETPTISLPREDVDLVITEHGAADLAGADLDERARRLIAIAAPAHRDTLAEAWDRARRSL